MKILVWGLGYVGSVSAACLARLGHEVVAVEPNRVKVERLNGGRPPVREAGLGRLIRRAVVAGRLRAVTTGKDAVSWADASLICVGTPSAPDGTPQLTSVRQVAAEIGRGLQYADRHHLVVLRSTVLPGTTRQVVIPLLEEHSRRSHGVQFDVVMNPDFTRETSAVADFLSPPYVVVGQVDPEARLGVGSVYEGIAAPLVTVALEQAECLKLVSNAFHALKAAFANEIGRFCDRLNVDARMVMDLVRADTTLNASAAYLEPGFAFGGSCLPKDLRSLTALARILGADLPILQSVAASNGLHIEAGLAEVRALRVQRVAVLGLGFKARSDDVRESPSVALIRGLLADGLDVTVYDPRVRLDEIVGSNRDHLEWHLPGIEHLLRPSLREALHDRQAVVVTQKRGGFARLTARLPPGVAVLDFTLSGPPSKDRRRANPDLIPCD